MNKRVTLLRMFNVSLDINGILSIYDCDKKIDIEYDFSDSLANQAVMYLNNKGIMINYISVCPDDTVALLTEDLNTDL